MKSVRENQIHFDFQCCEHFEIDHTEVNNCTCPGVNNAKDIFYTRSYIRDVFITSYVNHDLEIAGLINKDMVWVW